MWAARFVVNGRPATAEEFDAWLSRPLAFGVEGAQPLPLGDGAQAQGVAPDRTQQVPHRTTRNPAAGAARAGR